MAHHLPPFPQSVRFAGSEDIERLAIIAFAGGLQTDEFKYQRPYAQKYPLDTLDAWRHYLAASLRSERDTIIVIEDTANPDEDELTPSAVPLRYGDLGMGRCVVGFARIKLRPTYPNKRTFRKFEIRHWLSAGRKRDEHFDKSLEYSLRVALESKHLDDTNLTLETLTIHPAYHRRGHGRTLMSWVQDLARVDDAVIGIVATRFGIPLYRSLGFERVHSFEVATGVSVQLMRCNLKTGDMKGREGEFMTASNRNDIELRGICEGLDSLSLL